METHTGVAASGRLRSFSSDDRIPPHDPFLAFELLKNRHSR